MQSVIWQLESFTTNNFMCSISTDITNETSRNKLVHEIYPLLLHQKEVIQLILEKLLAIL